MQKCRIIFLLVFFLIFSSHIYAQNNSLNLDYHFVSGDYDLKAIDLSYNTSLNKWYSINLGIGHKMSEYNKDFNFSKTSVYEVFDMHNYTEATFNFGINRYLILKNRFRISFGTAFIAGKLNHTFANIVSVDTQEHKTIIRSLKNEHRLFVANRIRFSNQIKLTKHFWLNLNASVESRKPKAYSEIMYMYGFGGIYEF